MKRYGLIEGLLIFLIIFLSGSFAHAKILVISPHPDDDVLIAAGIIYSAVERQEPVKIVYMTNGDYYGGTDQGYLRQSEAVNAASHLGMVEDDLIFLGYPDGYLKNIYENYINATDIFTTALGQSTTYGNRGLGLTDYHSFRFGMPANYNRYNILTDLEDIISSFKPDQIFTLSEFDRHPDHSTTYELTKLALLTVINNDLSYQPVVHKTIVWWDNSSTWPNPIDPTAYFEEIPNLFVETGLDWNDRESFEVPLAMQSTNYTTNPKYLAVDENTSQGGAGGFLGQFIHKDEIFWAEHLYPANVARIATVSVSSETPEYGQLGIKAIDGVVDGSPGDYTKEWATLGELAGAWITLSWTNSQDITKIILYDRPNLTDNILSGTLTFSDGSSIAVGQLPNNGAGLTVTFPLRSVTWVKFTVDSAVGLNIGLAEIEVYAVARTSQTIT